MSGPFDDGPPPDPFDPYQRPFGDSFRPNPYGDGGPSLDGIAVAALVCSLTCCAAPVGIGLGIAGIVRTRDERRAGRWAAVAGLVLGVAVTIALAVGATALVVLGERTYYLEDARPGDCIDISGDSDALDMSEADCDEPHDAEVLHVGRFDDGLRRSYIDDADFCGPLAVRSGYAAVVDRGGYSIESVVDSDDVDTPELGDHFLCFAKEVDGDPLQAPLPRGDAPVDVPDERDRVVERVHSSDLEDGDCFNTPGVDEDDLVGRVTRVPCTTPHTYQVVGTIVLPAGRFPGDRAVEKRSDDCYELFDEFLGIAYEDSLYELSYYYPTAQSWRGYDDRTITCLAVHPRERKLTRSLEGIAR